MLFLERLGRVLHILSMTMVLRGSPSRKTKVYTAGSRIRLKSSLYVQLLLEMLLMILWVLGSVKASLLPVQIWEMTLSVKKGLELVECGIFTFWQRQGDIQGHTFFYLTD